MIAFWNYFIYFAMVAVLLWAAGACAAWKDRKVVAYSATIAGLVVFFSYILIMWISLDRPPMRTMGETRLWYSFFLPLAGIIVYSRWDYKWLLSFSTILALVFIGIMLFFKKSKIVTHKELDITDNLVYIGWAFLSLGMLTGALWAKDAWGHYWAWDPKETWAAATWLAYLTYIHYRLRKKCNLEVAMWILIVNFVLLQMCWWGINYLPSAQGTSVHTYNMQ